MDNIFDQFEVDSYSKAIADKALTLISEDKMDQAISHLHWEHDPVAVGMIVAVVDEQVRPQILHLLAIRISPFSVGR